MTKNAKLLPKLAKIIGERSVNATCVYWYHQPKVPTSMLKKENGSK